MIKQIQTILPRLESCRFRACKGKTLSHSFQDLHQTNQAKTIEGMIKKINPRGESKKTSPEELGLICWNPSCCRRSPSLHLSQMWHAMQSSRGTQTPTTRPKNQRRRSLASTALHLRSWPSTGSCRRRTGCKGSPSSTRMDLSAPPSGPTS